MSRVALRRAVVTAHRWFGLVGAIWLALLGLTGALLVFNDEIDSALAPQFHRALGAGEVEADPAASAVASRSLDAIAGAAAAAYPGSYVRFLDLPDRPGGVVRAFLRERPGQDAGLPERLELALDPASAELQGRRQRGAAGAEAQSWMPFLYRFHYSLQLGSAGTWALGLLAAVWLLDHFLAAYLAFPNPRRWAESFRIRRGARGHKRVFDLHRAVGVWLLPATFALALSGVYFNWTDGFRSAVGAISPLTPRYDQSAAALPEPLYAPPVGFERAVRIAERYAGDARVDSLSFYPDKGLYWARVFDPRDLAEGRGRRFVHVDARSGAVLSDVHDRDGTAGDSLIAWQFPLHSGKAFGWAGRLLILAAGIGLCLISVTGVLIWARKRRARVRSPRERARTTRPAPAAPGSAERPVAAFSGLPFRRAR